jgi:hypothetical protein
VKQLFVAAIIACGVVLLVGEDHATASSLTVAIAWLSRPSPPVVQAGFGCNFVNGHLVCGKKKSGDNDDNNDDDQGSHQKKQKHKDQDTGSDGELTQCTIQEPGGGGGCKGGFKHVCEKLKNGKKCCGCVPDKNASGTKSTGTETPATTSQIGYQCDANVSPANVGHLSYTMAPSQVKSEADARALFAQELKNNNYVATGPVTCKPVEYK